MVMKKNTDTELEKKKKCLTKNPRILCPGELDLTTVCLEEEAGEEEAADPSLTYNGCFDSSTTQ
jgi:hypothetical protein